MLIIVKLRTNFVGKIYIVIAAENGDVSITSTGVNIPEVVPQEDLQTSRVEMLFRLDGIAQEANETFTLGFNFDLGVLGSSPTLRDTLSGTVVDATGNDRVFNYPLIHVHLHCVAVAFQLSEPEYRESEGLDAMMPVIIAKASDVFLANPVTFMVIPLTVDEALAQGVIESFEAEDPFSPNRAG